MITNEIPSSFLKVNEIAYLNIIKPKVSASNPKRANFVQDILGRVPEDEFDTKVISVLRSKG